MKTVSSFLLIVWHLIQAAIAINNTLESTPDHINGQLLACVGDQISLTCSRDIDLVSLITQWTVTSPIFCDSVINHFAPISIERCDPFMFQNITEIAGSQQITVLSSTAVATANASMSGATIQCFTSDVSIVSRQIGPSIELCIPDQLSPPKVMQVRLMANGTVQIVWTRPPGVCTARNISYDVNLVLADGNPVDEGIELPMTIVETSIIFNLTPGREYRALLTANNTDCSISSDTVTKNFTAMQNAETTTESPTTLATTEKTTTQTVLTSTGLPQSTIIIIIIIIVVIVAVIIILIVAVVIWYFFYWRPKALLKHGSTTDANVELHVKSSEVDALVYEDPNPKVVSHTEAASGDLYAQPDKKGAESQGTYQDPNSIKHKQAPTGDEYAMPQQKGKKGKNQVSSVDPESADIAAMYSTVDTSKKNQLTYAQLDVRSGSGAKPAPQSTSYATVVS